MTDETFALDERPQDDTIDVSHFALRMGFVFPVHIQKEAYRRYCAKAGNPDRDVFVMIEAAATAIDQIIEEGEAPGLDLPFHYRHKAKGFREEDVRLFASVHSDNEGKPWILLHSTKFAPSVQAASGA